MVLRKPSKVGAERLELTTSREMELSTLDTNYTLNYLEL